MTKVFSENPPLAENEESPAAQTLGKKVLETDPARGYVKVSYYAGEHFVNRGGRIYGGFLAAMLDGLCGFAVRSSGPPQSAPPITLELKTSFIGRADVGELIGEGWVRHRGKSISFAEAELRDKNNNLIARASATFKSKP